MTSSYICPSCHIGRCYPATRTYLRFHKGMYISAPNMTMWQCDVCGYYEFDSDMLSELEMMLRVEDRNWGRLSSDVPDTRINRRIKS